MPAITEFDIQRAVCIYLERCALPDVVWWHTPNGGKRVAFEAKRLKQMGVKPGIHDLLFLHRGRLFGLELKAPGEGPSDAQRQMHPRMLGAGMAASAVVDDLMAARAQIFAWGLSNAI